MKGILGYDWMNCNDETTTVVKWNPFFNAFCIVIMSGANVFSISYMYAHVPSSSNTGIPMSHWCLLTLSRILTLLSLMLALVSCSTLILLRCVLSHPVVHKYIAYCLMLLSFPHPLMHLFPIHLIVGNMVWQWVGILKSRSWFDVAHGQCWQKSRCITLVCICDW